MSEFLMKFLGQRVATEPVPFRRAEPTVGAAIIRARCVSVKHHGAKDEAKASKRELIAARGDKRYVRRDATTKVGRCRPTESKDRRKAGQGDKGDRRPAAKWAVTKKKTVKRRGRPIFGAVASRFLESRSWAIWLSSSYTIPDSASSNSLSFSGKTRRAVRRSGRTDMARWEIYKH